MHGLFVTEGDLAGVMPMMTIDVERRGVSCHLSVQYHARNAELHESAEIVRVLRADLAVRAAIGVVNLKGVLES